MTASPAPAALAAPTGASAAEPVVQTRGLRLNYGPTTVLDGIDLTIGAGEIVALLGPNGAGKSSTIEVLEGFRLPSAGSVRVLGQDPARADDGWRSRVGIVLQSWRDHGRWTARELLTHTARHFAAARPWAPRPDVSAVLRRVGLTDKADAQLRTLSGGQRRRIDVAIGVLGDPELLFLDEPTAGLDPQARRDFHTLLRDQVRGRSTTVLLTTHDLDEAEALADRVLILAGGRIVADGAPAQLGTGPVVRWVQDGQPQRAELPAGADTTAFLRDLVGDPRRAITDVQVGGSRLEEIYLAAVGAAASEHPATPATTGNGGRR